MPQDDLKRFHAHFDSQCDECGRDIDEGDLIARTPTGEYICEECFEL